MTDDTSIDQGKVPLQEEESSSSEPSSPVPPVEAKLLQGLITSAISQGLSSIANRQDDQETQGECNLIPRSHQSLNMLKNHKLKNNHV